jgi:hypothetical protein
MFSLAEAMGKQGAYSAGRKGIYVFTSYYWFGPFVLCSASLSNWHVSNYTEVVSS